MSLQQRTAATVTALAMLTVTNTVLIIVIAFFVGDLREEAEVKHPTYHCDGSATMGYAVPGTPEAAACWIEGGKE